MTYERAAGPCEWGVMLPWNDPLRLGPRPFLEAARLAEESGFDSVWIGDHLSFNIPFLESVTALSAAAAVTSRVRLGTAVMQLAMRHLVWTAKQLASLDALSEGRLLLGVGVGGEYEPEWELAGADPRRRGKRTDEMIPELQAIMRGEGPAPAIEPVPGKDLPLLVGGRGDAALRRAARFGDAWLAAWLSPEEMAERGRTLQQIAHEEGRPVPASMLTVTCHVTDDRAAGRAEADHFVRGQYTMPFSVIERYSVVGPEEEVAEFLLAQRAAGVQGFVMFPMAADSLTQIERLATVRDAVFA